MSALTAARGHIGAARAALPERPIPIRAFPLKRKASDIPARRANLDKERCDKVPVGIQEKQSKKTDEMRSRPLHHF